MCASWWKSCVRSLCSTVATGSLLVQSSMYTTESRGHCSYFVLVVGRLAHAFVWCGFGLPDSAV